MLVENAGTENIARLTHSLPPRMQGGQLGFTSDGVLNIFQNEMHQNNNHNLNKCLIIDSGSTLTVLKVKKIFIQSEYIPKRKQKEKNLEAVQLSGLGLHVGAHGGDCPGRSVWITQRRQQALPLRRQLRHPPLHLPPRLLQRNKALSLHVKYILQNIISKGLRSLKHLTKHLQHDKHNIQVMIMRFFPFLSKTIKL